MATYRKIYGVGAISNISETRAGVGASGIANEGREQDRHYSE